ncbi:MAG: hypothetical protein HYU36_00875 [Planctomycetes bacterium]|nr:hypothetical protein [Planctomycetota bacterium]
MLIISKFREEMAKTGLLDKIDPRLWQIDWNVDSQAGGAIPHRKATKMPLKTLKPLPISPPH